MLVAPAVPVALQAKETRHPFIYFFGVAPVAVGRKIRDGVTWFPVLPAIEGEDSLKIIRCVIATRDLKDRFADRTGKAFLKALLPKPTKELWMEVELATCRTSLLRARPRLDLVCILLDRRIISSSRWVLYNNRSIHIQCDSSPIAGPELFGMLMDGFFLGYDVASAHQIFHNGPRCGGLYGDGGH